jgi:cytochrome P450
MTTKLQIQQAVARVQQCLEDPLICAPFPECDNDTMSKDEYIALVVREQALARFKCEQELVRLDECIARLDEARLDEDRVVRIDLKSFDTCEILAPLHFLYEKRIMNFHSLIDAAVQEFLRFFSPLPEMARTLIPETGGVDLPVDRYVGISFISGNFDESIFENPLELSFLRERNPHLSFGFGPHTCIGNHLAEIEAKVFLSALLGTGYSWSIAKEQITFHTGQYSVVPDRFEQLQIAKRKK